MGKYFLVIFDKMHPVLYIVQGVLSISEQFKKSTVCTIPLISCNKNQLCMQGSEDNFRNIFTLLRLFRNFLKLFQNLAKDIRWVLNITRVPASRLEVL